MDPRRQVHLLHARQAVSQPSLADSDVFAAALTRVRAAETRLEAMQAALVEVARLSGAQYAALLIRATEGEKLTPRLACQGEPGQAYEIVAPAVVLGGTELNWPQAEASARSVLPASLVLKTFERSVGEVWLDRIVCVGSQAHQKRAAIDALAHQLALIVENGELRRELEERQAWLNAANALDITPARRVDYDPLTQVPNRVLFGERLEQAVKRAQQPGGRQFAVLFLDVDGFKAVNDSLGHLAGDQLLVAIAQRLAACLRANDTIARFGGDEFTILLEDVADLGAAHRVAERIRREFARPFDLEGREWRVGVSMGVALSAAGYARPEDMLRAADVVMYRAKSLGKARQDLHDSVEGAHA